MLDFIVKEGFTPGHPVLFSVIKSWGLHLFDISTSNSQTFMHQSREQIDFFVNAIYGTVFIGVLVEQRNNNLLNFYLHFRLRR